MSRFFIIIFAAAMAMTPTAAFAQAPDDFDDLLVRVDGDITIPAGETVGVVIVISGNAIIEGTVTEAVVVIHGDAIVSGTIEGDLTVISGNVDLQSGARVEDVSTMSGEIEGANDTTVSGNIEENENAARSSISILALLSVYLWFAMTFSLLLIGLVFAAIAGRQLNTASELLTAGINTFLATLFAWIALPIIGVILLITIVGLPLGLAVLLVVLPMLWILGYVVAGCRFGSFVLSKLNRGNGGHPYLATALGVLLLQLIVLIPGIGWLIGSIAALWGGGALVRLALSAIRRGDDEPSEAAPLPAA